MIGYHTKFAICVEHCGVYKGQTHTYTHTNHGHSDYIKRSEARWANNGGKCLQVPMLNWTKLWWRIRKCWRQFRITLWHRHLQIT